MGRSAFSGRIEILAAIVLAGSIGPLGSARAQSGKAAGAERPRVGASRGSTSSLATRPAATPRRGAVEPGDDATFRPTVLIRRATSQGTGTIIASTSDQTLILTAAHVVRDEGPITVELHRFNIGLERTTGGAWPLLVRAEVAASDAAADLAVLRMREHSPLPFVAKLYEGDPGDLRPDTLVTSLGIDLGARLSSWNTKVVETTRLQLEGEEQARPFLVTLKTPEHGRSGGGLFVEGGRLVGVCVGHAELIEGRRMGVFASIASIRRLLHEHDLDALMVRPQANAAPRTDRGPSLPASF